NPVLRIHELHAAATDGVLDAVYGGPGDLALVHRALFTGEHRATERAGQRLLANDVLAGIGSRDDERLVQRVRHADADDIDCAVRQQLTVGVVHGGDTVLPRERVSTIAAGCNDRGELDADAEDALQAFDLQARREAGTDETDG